MPEEKMRIKVQYSTDALFGSADPADFGGAASIAQFGSILTNRLHNAYHDAEITVTHDIDDDVRVDGQQDHDEVPRIDQIIGEVYGSYSWIVEK